MKKLDNRTIMYCILAGALPFIFFVLSTALSGMLPGQKHCFVYGDALIQYLSIAKNFWRNLFTGRSLVYSFCNGMGMPTIAINAFYSLSPFHSLSYFISDTNLAGFLIVCLKMVCSSLSMFVLIKKVLEMDDFMSVFFSTAYALCSYFAFFYIAICLTDMLYIMPLIILALWYFIRTGRWGWLCIIYTYSFIVQFYCAYMMGIFSAVIFVSYAWYQYGKTIQLWKKAITRYVVCVFIAVLLAAPVLVPAAYEIFSLRTSDHYEQTDFVLLPWNFLAGFYPGQSQGITNSIPYMYVGLPLLVLLIAFFVDKKNTMREKIFAAIPLCFLTLCSFVEILYLLMHAFDSPNWYSFRFSCLVCVWVVLVAAKEMNNILKHSVNRGMLWTIGAVIVFTYLLIWILQNKLDTVAESTMTLQGMAIISGLLIIYVILLFGIKDRGSLKIVFGMCLSAELLANIMVGQSYAQDSVLDKSIYRIADAHIRESLKLISEEEVKDPWQFYRIRYLNSITDNVSTENGFNGLGYFCSIENENIRNMLEKYGYSTATLIVNDYGSTPFMQMIFSQKYDVECGSLLGENLQYRTFRKNECVLPLGYMVDNAMLDYRTSDISPFEAQNDLASAMCGNHHDIFFPYIDDVYISGENVDIAQQNNSTIFSRNGDVGKVTYEIESDEEGDVYAYMRRWGITCGDNTCPKIFSRLDVGSGNTFSVASMPHIIPLMKDEDGKCRLYIRMDNAVTPVFDYEKVFFAYENKKGIKEVYDELCPGAMEVVSFRDNRIEGFVKVSHDKQVLFTTIPYNDGWQVYVDGKKAETFSLLDDAFLGVMLEEGEHELLFVYKNKLSGIGCVLGILGLILFVTAVVIKKKTSEV